MQEWLSQIPWGLRKVLVRLQAGAASSEGASGPGGLRSQLTLWLLAGAHGSSAGGPLLMRETMKEKEKL